MSVVKPPMSKVADVFGRLEAFSLSVFIYIIGYVQQAAADSVRTYAAAQIFYSAGQTGLQILIQIFIADTSDLLNRALCTTLPNVPFLATVWIGPTLAQTVLDTISWRWGYGIWAIVLPLAFMPLALAMFVNQKRAAKLGILPKSQFEGLTAWEAVITLWYELDAFGLVLICAAFSLILIPLTIAESDTWNNGPTLAMLAIGVCCLVAFPLWERSKRLAPRAFFPRDLLNNRTVIAGMFLAFFYFSRFLTKQCDYSVLTIYSGILPVYLSILPILSSGRPGPVCFYLRQGRADFHIQRDDHWADRLAHHQAHQALQILRGLRHYSICVWIGPHDAVSKARSINTHHHLHSNGGRHWRRADQWARSTWSPSSSKPPKCSLSDCYLPHSSRDWRCCWKCNLRGDLVTFHPGEACTIPAARNAGPSSCDIRKCHSRGKRLAHGKPYAECHQSRIPGDYDTDTHRCCLSRSPVCVSEFLHAELQA